MAKILLVEDNEASIEFVSTWLTGERHVLEVARDGQEALEYVKMNDFDIVLLDWELPAMTGLQFLRQIRAQGKLMPVIMLTGRGAIDDKEEGFDAGADDYLTKPYDLVELSARIRAQLRRASNQISNTIAIGQLMLDPVRYQVKYKEQEIALLPKEFSMLEHFMRNPDRLFSVDSLLQRLWNLETESTTDAFRSALKRLRKKLADRDVPDVIETVHGAGLRFNSSTLKQ
ncbi:MAG TPA: response regulator transcription factor [Planktothrix sp.]